MYLLVADDLTGGNDAGIQFAKRGIETRATITGDAALSLAPVDTGERLLVVNTNTRNLPADVAGERLAAMVSAVKQAMGEQPQAVYQKIDSTLRGHPGVEIDAVMSGFGFSAAFVAPSYPQQGRSVIDGDLFVADVPLHLTGFAADPLTPVTTSSVAANVNRSGSHKTGLVPVAVMDAGEDAVTRRIQELIRSEGADYVIFDAQTPEHLATIAAVGLAMADRPLFVGSAGLAEAVASRLSPHAATLNAEAKRKSLPVVERVFVVCGSAHQTAHHQTLALADAGVPVIRLPEDVLDNPASAAAATDEVVRALGEGAAVLATPVARLETRGTDSAGLALSAAMAAAALEVLARLKDSPHSVALVMTGGETAYSILHRLSGCLDLHAELLPGIALVTVSGGAWHGLKAVTKAGGFGGPQTLLQLVQMLRQSDTVLRRTS